MMDPGLGMSPRKRTSRLRGDNHDRAIIVKTNDCHSKRSKLQRIFFVKTRLAASGLVQLNTSTGALMNMLCLFISRLATATMDEVTSLSIVIARQTPTTCIAIGITLTADEHRICHRSTPQLSFVSSKTHPIPASMGSSRRYGLTFKPPGNRGSNPLEKLSFE